MEQGVAKRNQNKPQTGIKAISSFLNGDSIKKKFQEVLGDGGPAFVSSLLTVISQNDKLQNANQNSIYTAALMAASLKLPINQNLGFAYIIPYNDRQKGQVAQFQIGAKGFLQLAQRTGQYKTINSTDVREGEIKSYDRLTGKITFEWIEDYNARKKAKIVGYVNYFELNEGFSSTFYMSVEELTDHGKKYSKTFQKGFGLWVDDFDSMALKTVTKLNISKNGPLSVDMQKAITSDQAVIKSDSFINEPETLDVEPEFIDNPENDSKEEKVETKKETVKKAQTEAKKKQEEKSNDSPGESKDDFDRELFDSKGMA